MSRFPTEIRLLGVSIPVNVSYCKSKDPLSDDEEVVFGEWDMNDMTITLNSKCSPVHSKVTLLHELVHAIDDMLGLELDHQDIYCLSQALYQLVSDNPKLVDYLVSTELPVIPRPDKQERDSKGSEDSSPKGY